MKISKVNHTHAAVVKINDGKSGGILYVDPSQSGALDLGKRFDSLNRKAQRLYNFFNPVQAGTEPKEVKKRENESDDSYLARKENNNISKANYERRLKWERKIGPINKTIRSVMFYDDDKKNRHVCDSRRVLENLGQQQGLTEQDINEVVTLFLRNSLSKCAENVKTLLRCMGKSGISEQEKVEINELIDFVKKDFEKTEAKNRIIRSIKNQNMTVQPQKGVEDPILRLSDNKNSKSNSIKKDEKEGLNNFISDYADLNPDSRMEMLRKLRRLVDLYFGAPNEYQKGDILNLPQRVNCDPDYDVWKVHEAAKQENEAFADIPKGLLKAYNEKRKLDSVEQKQDQKAIMDGIRTRNIICYRYSLAVVENDDRNLFFSDIRINKFWIHHIQSAVERILKNISVEKLYRNDVGYLSEKVWKDLLNYLCVKYIAIGKAVFNFAMEDVYTSEVRDIELGKITKAASEGITSFDYEYIKAGETLQRETAVAVAFATNNVARSIVNIPEPFVVLDKNGKEKEIDMSDFLLWEEKDITDRLHSKEKYDTVGSILQFFGGKSKWDMEVFDQAYNGDPDVGFASDIRKAIYSLRNSSFHFTTANIDKGSWNISLIASLFEKEAKFALTSEKNKLYSNNLCMFYRKSDLKAILDKLYGKYSSRASQVPAFNKVFVRKNFVNELKNMGLAPSFTDEKTLLMWQNSIYYLFKEIYYNAFLTDPAVKKLVIDTVYEIKKNPMAHVNDNKNDKDQTKIGRAANDFADRFIELKNHRLEEICQIIMSEYNLQNQGSRKKKTSNASPFDKDIFQHYKMLLMKVLMISFEKYVKSSFPQIIKTDNTVYEPGSVEDFLPNWESPMYDNLIKEVGQNAELQKWYIVSHFLNGKMLNQLGGSVRSYIQYVQDIKRRAEETGNKLCAPDNTIKEDIKRCHKIVEIIDLCVRSASNISHEFTDYFKDEDDYALYLSKYLDYGTSDSGLSAWAELGRFCNDGEVNYGIYRDVLNPIPNRNIVMSKLYGADTIIPKVINRVNEDIIKEYYQMIKEIDQYRIKGKCDSEDEQKKLLHFQKIKNKIEFRDIVEYSELINDLLGQLINWSFLRERDLLYFQLGFHYACLYNKSRKPEGYDIVKRNNGTTVKGTILRQIAGLYINGIGILGKTTSGDYKEAAQAGGSFGRFYSYSNKVMESTGFYAPDDEEGRKNSLYLAGLELFENLNEHESIVKKRNDIDHFKYYMGKAGSLLDLYSEVFDRFFTYDMKYQKNVINMLENILMRYFIILSPKVGSGKKIMDNGDSKDRAKIDIAPRGISSDEFSYAIRSSKVKTPAKDNDFLNTVTKLLYYPDEMDVSSLVKVQEEFSVSKLNEKKDNHPVRKQGNNHNQKNRGNMQNRQTNNNLNNKKSTKPKTVYTSSSDESFVNTPFKDRLDGIKI